MIKSISVLIQSIQKAIILAFAAIGFVIAVIWGFTLYSQHKTYTQNTNQQVQSAINLFKSELSSNLSIVANSQVFVNYLRSGPVSRSEQEVQFLTRMDALKPTPVVGVGIYNTNHSTIFKSGTKSPYFVNLKLCYYNNELNSHYGNCTFTWRLYLNKEQVLSSILSKNPNIHTCKNCAPANVLKSNKFGSFNVESSSSMNLGLKMSQSYSTLIYLLVFVLLLLIALFTWVFLKVNRLISAYIYVPVRNIIDNLQSGQLPETKDYIAELHYLGNEIKQFYENKDKIEKGRLLGEITHDLKNYYYNLITIIKELNLSPENRDKIKRVTKDIEAILNSTLDRFKPSNDIHSTPIVQASYSVCSLAVHASKLAEIRCHTEGVLLTTNIPPEVYPIYVEVNPVLLNRIIINLIQNSVEANASNVLVSVESNNKDIVSISIKDDGKGIPEDILPTIGNKQITYGKINGHGLGLVNAKKAVEEWGGTLKIESPNTGTIISILLPKAMPCSTFCKEIDLLRFQKVVIIDDDQTIHETWKNRLPEENLEIFNIYTLHQANTLLNQIEPSEPILFLIDYNLDTAEMTGLDLIVRYKLADRAILVTNMSEDDSLIHKCIELHLKLLPKTNIDLVPLIT